MNITKMNGGKYMSDGAYKIINGVLATLAGVATVVFAVLCSVYDEPIYVCSAHRIFPSSTTTLVIL